MLCQRGLAGAIVTQHDQEAALLDRDIHAAQRSQRRHALLIGRIGEFQFPGFNNIGHCTSSYQLN